MSIKTNSEKNVKGKVSLSEEKQPSLSRIKRKKEKKLFLEGRMYIGATFNNTIVSITDLSGKVADWTSSGKIGFKGTRKSTPFAAIATIEDAVKRALGLGIKRLEVYIKGPGPGRDAALRVLRASREVDINLISDVTPIPHNGPRPPKRRRG